MNFLSRRLWLIAGATAMFAAGSLGVACSNSNPYGDGGTDSGNPNDATLDQQNNPDGNQNKDGGSDGGNPIQSCEAGLPGTCDIVQQDCTGGKQCAVVQVDGGFQTACVAGGTGSFPEGTACTSNNQCVAGLECIESRCARHCCLGDDTACSTSKPEGFPGKCNLNITLPDNSIGYAVCTYDKPCQPFQIQGCGGGLTCLVQDSNGTANCSAYPNGDAGLAEKATCTSANACNDGMGCFGSLDGGTSQFCQWNCYNKGQGGPYDSQIAADAGAGHGGCPNGETCKLINWSGNTLPSWFGICQ